MLPMSPRNLLSRIQVSGPDDCWPWTGQTSQKGYGTIGYRLDGKRRNLRAHRLAWELRNGRPIPEGLLVRHLCHNPVCCNPGHLALGTHADNYQDMVEAGRRSNPRGEGHWRSKLSREDVLAIRRDYSSGGVSMRALGKRYGVDATNIHAVVTGKTWGHVGGLSAVPRDRRPRGEETRASKLTADDVREIRASYRKGSFGYVRLGKKYGVDPQTIKAIVRRETWSHVP